MINRHGRIKKIKSNWKHVLDLQKRYFLLIVCISDLEDRLDVENIHDKYNVQLLVFFFYSYMTDKKLFKYGMSAYRRRFDSIRTEWIFSFLCFIFCLRNIKENWLRLKSEKKSNKSYWLPFLLKKKWPDINVGFTFSFQFSNVLFLLFFYIPLPFSKYVNMALHQIFIIFSKTRSLRWAGVNFFSKHFFF